MGHVQHPDASPGHGPHDAQEMFADDTGVDDDADVDGAADNGLGPIVPR